MKHLIYILFAAILMVGCDTLNDSSTENGRVEGTINQIDQPASTLTVDNLPVYVTERTDIADQAGTALQFYELRVGDFVAITGSEDEAGTLVAETIEQDVSKRNTGGAPAGDEVCRGTFGDVVFENLFVPDDATCVLDGTTVNGNIVVGTDATLTANGIDVEGNIQAEGARDVTSEGQSVVGGNIQIKQGDRASVTDVTVDGDVQIESQSGSVSVARTVVGGNMQIFQNEGGVSLRDNRIAENMQCKENTPPPSGGGNTAGNKEDQCSNL